jgi:hypothetical protein
MVVRVIWAYVADTVNRVPVSSPPEGVYDITTELLGPNRAGSFFNIPTLSFKETPFSTDADLENSSKEVLGVNASIRPQLYISGITIKHIITKITINIIIILLRLIFFHPNCFNCSSNIDIANIKVNRNIIEIIIKYGYILLKEYFIKGSTKLF